MVQDVPMYDVQVMNEWGIWCTDTSTFKRDALDRAQKIRASMRVVRVQHWTGADVPIPSLLS